MSKLPKLLQRLPPENIENIKYVGTPIKIEIIVPEYTYPDRTPILRTIALDAENNAVTNAAKTPYSRAIHKVFKDPSTIYKEINTEAWKRELTMPEPYKSLEENRKRC